MSNKLEELEQELGAEQEAEQKELEAEEAKNSARAVDANKRLLSLGDVLVNQELTDGRGIDPKSGQPTKTKVPTGNCFGIEVDQETGAFVGAVVIPFSGDKGYELQNVRDRAMSGIEMIATPRNVGQQAEYANFPPFGKDNELVVVLMVRKRE